jgi:ABC-2 type transport system permease protein
MRLSKSWIIAAKDFKIFSKKKYIIYSLVAVPLIVASLLPLVIYYAEYVKGGTRLAPAELLILLPAFLSFYLILAGVVPNAIASYTLVGEKVEKSLEPLLATPTTDGEILLGKGIAAFLPPIGSIWGGAAILMILMDAVTHDKLGYYYFPTWNAAVFLLVLIPLAVMLSVEVSVMISSRVSDVRAAQQLGYLMALPYAGIYLAGERNFVNLGDTNDLLTISGILLAAVIALLFLVRATFRREEILTRWK